MTTRVNEFTQCVRCKFARSVEEIDRAGLIAASREVAYCDMFAQYRALRLIRTCADFKRFDLPEAA